MPAWTLGLEGVDCEIHIDWRGERSIIYKGVETSSYHTRFKNLEEKS